MFGNQNQYSGGNNNTINQNTDLFKGFSDDSQITLSGWNNKLSLKLRPFAGKNSSGINTYERDAAKIVNTAITIDNCAVLVEAIEKELEPAMEQGQPAAVTLLINEASNNGSKKLLTLDYDGSTLRLIIAFNVGEDNKTIPQYQRTYTFKNRNYLKGYDAETGDSTPVSYYAEGKVFIDIIKDYIKLIPISHHAAKYSKATEYHPQQTHQNANQPMSYQPQQQVPQMAYSQPAPLTQGGSFADQDLPF